MEAPSEKILIVEDDADMAETCRRLFRRAGLEAEAVYDGESAIERLRADTAFTIVLTDLRMPGMDGTEVLKKAKEIRPDIDVIMMTGYGTIQNAIQAMKIGASDYITKPFDREELLRAVRQILEQKRLRQEVAQLRSELRELKKSYGSYHLVGRGPAMQRVFELIRAASSHESPVLIVGETGTGKEQVARAIHHESSRAKQPFVPVNCAAIPRELYESELFGHRRGAFTGATQDTLGLIRAAQEGTLFLDEVVEMPLDTQARLLRAIQEKMVRRIGDTAELPVDVRFLSASSVPGDQAIRLGKLRQDLYYRLSVITIHLPPLRERIEDVPFLAQHFLERYNKQFLNKVESIDPRAMDLLCAYPWPGNVRELSNVIESLFAMGARGRIEPEDLPEHVRRRGSDATGGWMPSVAGGAAPGGLLPGGAAPGGTVPGGTVPGGTVSGGTVPGRTFPGGPAPAGAGPAGAGPLADAERHAVEQALRAARGNKSRAASILGISRTRLYNKLRQYGLLEVDEEDSTR